MRDFNSINFAANENFGTTFRMPTVKSHLKKLKQLQNMGGPELIYPSMEDEKIKLQQTN